VNTNFSAWLLEPQAGPTEARMMKYGGSVVSLGALDRRVERKNDEV